MSSGMIIARGGLALRKSPKTGDVLKMLRRNSKVEILEKETWLKVKTSDGEEGFVLADFVEVAPDDLVPAQGELPAVAAAETAPRSTACDIRVYRNTRFIGSELRADLDFFPCLDRLNTFAVDCGIEIFVTSSTREPGRTVRGAIVPPASRSNHLVGHGVDMNLRSDGTLFNSQALKLSNLPNLPAEVRNFLNRVRDDGELRWGGDFRQEDPVHIDDNLNGRDAALWDSKLASRA